MNSRPKLPYLWMLSGSVAFALMATQAHALAGSLDWLHVAATRAGLAFLFALLLAWNAGAQLVFLRPRTIWVRSLAGTVSLLCTFYALPRMPIADTLTLTNVFPVWVALLSWPLEGETPTRDVWAAIAVGLLGVVLVAQPHLETTGGLAALAAVGSSLSTSISMLGLHRLKQVDPRSIVAHFSGVSLVTCVLLIGLGVAGPMFTEPAATASVASAAGMAGGEVAGDVETPDGSAEMVLLTSGGMRPAAIGPSPWIPPAWALLLGVGICATTGQLFLTKAFAAGPPAKVSVVALSQVGFGMLCDLVFWGHQFTWLSLAGIVLVMAPTVWLLWNHGQAGRDLSPDSGGA